LTKDAGADTRLMQRALQLADRGRGLVSPNPLVGAVLARGDEVVGEGWHRGPGTPHAEVVALEAAGDRARGATLYVTLEPCSHTGRTPPCAPAIVEAGVSRVVVATGDPNPLVDGAGLKVLRDAGVQVEVGLLQVEAGEQNVAFFHHVRTGLPHVTLKMAASLDGRAAARDGSSKWISGEASRRLAHRMRAGADAIMVGAGTALEDDPSLTCRDPDYDGPPKLRVVVDGRGIVPVTHNVFDQEAPTLVATTTAADPGLVDGWRGRAEVWLHEAPDGRVPLDDLMKVLESRGVQSVLLEGGPTLAEEMVRAGLVHRVAIFFGPILLGGAAAPGILMGEGVPTIDQAVRLDLVSVERIEDDVVVMADVHRDR
jgi:diaminohydroxyphosphoribosylaminopyrimidine deaminase/5-amino-6-(5-phosphoribosylamino)uracil reductase